MNKIQDYTITEENTTYNVENLLEKSSSQGKITGCKNNLLYISWWYSYTQKELDGGKN